MNKPGLGVGASAGISNQKNTCKITKKLCIIFLSYKKGQLTRTSWHQANQRLTEHIK
jgi:hypothetical protein